MVQRSALKLRKNGKYYDSNACSIKEMNKVDIFLHI